MTRVADTAVDPRAERPWPAMWSLVLGFFMILVDSTIVTIATPALMRAFDADVTSVVWVTSAYLLAYATPLLVTGRLGDRFGPKPVYLTGLGIFTLASLACGFATSIELLIAARVVQGLGAALLTPQTMAVITRIFPPDRRGAALGLWGGIAGLATLVGPLVGGLLVDSAGWAWIFFINIPVGVVGFLLVMRTVPRLPVHAHRFDVLGMALSAAGMLALVLGVQEVARVGPVMWAVVALGVALLAAFVRWQWVQRGEPLLPLALFRDRNFTLGSIAISAVGFAITAQGVPLFLYLQTARGLSSTESALLLLPMAILAGVLSPLVGRALQGRDVRWTAVLGVAAVGGSLAWFAAWMAPGVDIAWLLLPSALLGIGNACLWSPISITTTRNLPMAAAGAGAGVYNTMRQVGAVIGAAAIAALMTARLTAELGAEPTAAQESGQGGLPEAAVLPFSTAMGQSMLLPALVLLVALVAALCFAPPRPAAAADEPTARRADRG
ncbi:DHA2 family efflux MFS transporter permease subunit [Agrococcus citreus]|uniref:MFS transporter n=1 Tax=Agrococcus citreus TaxID=84643 RepID=A0ABN1YNL0_9MICO